MRERRWAYFTFQGLLTVVLLLFFFYQRHQSESWGTRFEALSLALVFVLVAIRIVAPRTLSSIWFQTGLFVADVLLTTLTLYWTEQFQSNLYLSYSLIIFGTALTRNLSQGFLVALVASFFYVLSAWDASLDVFRNPDFWLRVPFLWIMAIISAILCEDSKAVQREQEERYQERIRQMERLAALGQLAGEVAHSIKGPLTTILVNAEVLAHRHGKTKKIREELEQIQQEVQHSKEILKNLLSLGRIEETELKPIDLRESIRSALKSAEPWLRKSKVRLTATGLEKTARVMGDQSLLHDALFAVIENALEVMPEGGDLEVGLASTANGSFWHSGAEGKRNMFQITVRDSGPGIAPENLERVFKPFFTTKGKDGTGLGLSAALRIFQNHGGFVEAQSEGLGRGACFTLTLPRA